MRNWNTGGGCSDEGFGLQVLIPVRLGAGATADTAVRKMNTRESCLSIRFMRRSACSKVPVHYFDMLLQLIKPPLNPIVIPVDQFLQTDETFPCFVTEFVQFVGPR